MQTGNQICVGPLDVSLNMHTSRSRHKSRKIIQTNQVWTAVKALVSPAENARKRTRCTTAAWTAVEALASAAVLAAVQRIVKDAVVTAAHAHAFPAVIPRKSHQCFSAAWTAVEALASPAVHPA